MYKKVVSTLSVVALALVPIPALVRAQAPIPGPPRDLAVRAGKMFDPKSGTNLMNQVILIHGDRITQVGPAAQIQIPASATVIDLSQETVLPGLIDGHVHLTDAVGGLQHQQLVALYSATQSLNAGFTTLVAQGSHGGGYADVELRKGIESGIVKGPRIITAGPVIEITEPGNGPYPLEFAPFQPSLLANGPQAFRNAVREIAHNGGDHVKITTTGRFHFTSSGEMINEALPTREELAAAVDEAHKLGMWVATHSYGGDGLKWPIELGVDNIQHAVAADDADIKMIVQKNLAITPTILDMRQDEPGDLKLYGQYSRFRLMEETWKKFYAAGVRLGWGSGAAPPPGRVFNKDCFCSHGVQAEAFAVYVKWGTPALYTLRMATTVNADIIHMSDSVGTIEKGKFADLIAVSGDPLQDITELQRVKFVMKGGDVIKNELTSHTK